MYNLNNSNPTMIKKGLGTPGRKGGKPEIRVLLYRTVARTNDKKIYLFEENHCLVEDLLCSVLYYVLLVITTCLDLPPAFY
jgi:hypothetical protein